MEIVSIEKKTFEMMVAAFGALSEKVAALRRKSDTGRMERWLTGEEVCGQLRISPRTLQTLRDRRLIGYSQINRRFYYKPEEVKRLIPLVGTLYPHGRSYDERDQRCFYDGRRADSLCDAGYAQRLEMAVCISGKLPPSAGRGTLPD